MEQNKSLGIYICNQRAVVSVIAKGDDGFDIVDAFVAAVPLAEDGTEQEFSYSKLISEVAVKCVSRNISVEGTSVTIDCTAYRQQILHSEFTDHKQIAHTVAFDAEEALAVDAAETAIAFEVIGKGMTGSEISVFASDGPDLSEMIIALQNNKMDPIVIEPDSICLRRFIRQNIGEESTKSIWVAVSQRSCYLITPSGAESIEIVRAFITGSRQNKTSLLSREVIMTMAAAKAVGKPESLKVFDVTNAVDLGALQGSVRIETQGVNLAEKSWKVADNPDEPLDVLTVIIAAGAAIGQLTKTNKVDFRALFMPYQGKKMAMEKTAKVLSIAMIVVFVALGIYLHMQYWRTNNYKSRQHEKFVAEYKIAIPGGKVLKKKDPIRKLKSEINRIKDVKSGLLSAAGDDSVEAKMTFLFEALNSVPKNIDLDIAKMAVTTKTMNINGNTSSRGYLGLFSSIDKHPNLAKGQSTYKSKDGRDYFSLTIEMQ